MNIVYFILGGNIGDRLKNLEKARNLILERVGKIIKSSDVFITAAWGKTDQPDFYNQALEVSTELDPKALLDELIKIEMEAGRIRTGEKWAERTIDIDILFYNNDIVHEPHLKIPHPHLQDRRFVLVPLDQIAAGYVHPVLQKNIHQLLQDCTDHSSVRVLDQRSLKK
jgi:2-amino-4-hydroxy-6-hydroxymethyldihydropteridine diphosphokinase